MSVSRSQSNSELTKVTDNLFLGGSASLNEVALVQHGITSIINCTAELNNPNFPQLSDIEYIKLGCYDIPTEDISKHFESCSEHIRRVEGLGGKTLVHCIKGVSRSVTICLAYLIPFQNMTLREAFFHIKSRRHNVHPNPGFWRQLIEFEKSLLGKATVKMMVYPQGAQPDVYKEELHATNNTRRETETDPCQETDPYVEEMDPSLKVTEEGLPRCFNTMAFFTQIAQITDHLYLCGASALHTQKLTQLGITHVINCTIDVPNVHSKTIETTRISLEDAPHSRLYVHFDQCADKIQKVHENGGRVLVHCVAGVSRSASICIAYIMKYKRLNLKEAYHYVKERRQFIRPNVGFFRQLIDYERKLFGKNSVSMVSSPIGTVPTVYKEETRHMVWY